MLGIFKENTAVQKLIRTRYEVIFYAENAYYFQYFSHLFEAMQSAGKKTCYITSDKNDPVFEKQGPNTDVVFSKSTLACAFDELQADVDAWIREYNGVRPHSGKYCFGKNTHADIPACKAPVR